MVFHTQIGLSYCERILDNHLRSFSPEFTRDVLYFRNRALMLFHNGKDGTYPTKPYPISQSPVLSYFPELEKLKSNHNVSPAQQAKQSRATTGLRIVTFFDSQAIVYTIHCHVKGWV